MQLYEIMTGGIETIAPDASLQAAAQKMTTLDVGILPVREGDKLIGAITDRDITIRAVAQGLDPVKTPVRYAMTEMVVCGFADQDIKEGTRLMMDNQIRRLFIIDRDKQLIGIVSLADLALGVDDKDLAGQVLTRISEPAQVPMHA